MSLQKVKRFSGCSKHGFIRPIVLLCFLAAAPGEAMARDTGEKEGVLKANAKKISEVASGKRSTARATWWGFDPEDATAALQAALDSSADKVVIDHPGCPWIVTPIQLPDNKEIVFEDGTVVEAKRGAFLPKNACLFSAVGSRNLTLRGPKAILRMHKEDYHRPPYQLAEWRHALTLRGCRNVKVIGLTLQASGGDGIYLGVGQNNTTNQKILIRDVICDDNNRQGISVITAEDLTIENCIFRNTRGTAPESGIDFEPNHADERLVRCVVRDCLSENNGGHAYHVYLGNMHEDSPPISLRFENCVSKNCDRFSAFCGMNHREGKRPVGGSIVFEDCRFEDDRSGGIYVRGNEAEHCDITFSHCRIVRPESPQSARAAIIVEGPRMFDRDAGNITFDDCLIEGALAGDLPLEYQGSPLARLRNLSGKLTHLDSDTLKSWSIDDEFLARLTPNQKTIRKIPFYFYDWRELKPLHDDRNDRRNALPFRQRKHAEWIIWAKEGEEVEIAANYQPVGKATSRIGNWKLTTSDGASREWKPEQKEDSSAIYTFVPETTGPCRIEWRENSSTTVHIQWSNAPIACRSSTQGLHLFRPLGEFFFVVPASVERFALQVSGAGSLERVHARLFDGEGRLFEERKDIAFPHLFLVERDRRTKGPEIWSLRFRKPSEGILEDVSLHVLGIPDLFSGSSASLLFPRKNN